MPVIGMYQNPRSACSGIGDRHPSESAIDIIRITQEAHSEASGAVRDDKQITERRPWHGSEGFRQPIPPEVISDAQQLVADLDLREDQWEHLRLRVEDKLQPKEIAEFLGITANNERVRWHRLWKKIESEAMRHPHLADYGAEIYAEELDAEAHSFDSEAKPD
jgi:hypothetical protein